MYHFRVKLLPPNVTSPSLFLRDATNMSLFHNVCKYSFSHKDHQQMQARPQGYSFCPSHQPTHSITAWWTVHNWEITPRGQSRMASHCLHGIYTLVLNSVFNISNERVYSSQFPIFRCLLIKLCGHLLNTKCWAYRSNRYTQFWLLRVVKLYKVTESSEFVNTKSLLSGEYEVLFLRASGENTFINWSTYNLVLCVFLFKDTFLNNSFLIH